MTTRFLPDPGVGSGTDGEERERSRQLEEGL